MEKIIKVDNKEMKARASALIPKKYRYHFGRDIIQDMKILADAMEKNKSEGKSMEITQLEIFENVAWLFFKLGGEEVGNSPDEWLDSLDGMFSVYIVLPQLLDLWMSNLEQLSKPKKK